MVAGQVEVSANYPLFSPDYKFNLYAATLVVTADAEFDARYTRTEWGSTGLINVVFGRGESDTTWRVLADPEGQCPPLPEGADWPSD